MEIEYDFAHHRLKTKFKVGDTVRIIANVYWSHHFSNGDIVLITENLSSERHNIHYNANSLGNLKTNYYVYDSDIEIIKSASPEGVVI